MTGRDLAQVLGEVRELVQGARAMPLSTSAVVHRPELLALIDELQELLPAELDSAARVLADRDALLEAAHADAQALRAQGEADRVALIEQTEVWQSAQEQADEVVQQAAEQAAQMRREVEQYVDGKLANFEVVLHRVLAAVERGRAKLAGVEDVDALSGDEDDPPPGRR